MSELRKIKMENFEAMADAEMVVAIVKQDGQFWVHQHTVESVAPRSGYDTAREAASRMLQLLHIGPVAPQTWPETACIGVVEFSPTGGQHGDH